VDLICVTKIGREKWSPAQAMAPFKKMATDKYGPQDKGWRKQGRSLGILEDGVDLDLVVTAAPRHVDPDLVPLAKAAALAANARIEQARSPEDALLDFFANLMQEGNYKDEPLDIPDQPEQVWDETHPAAQLKWHKQRQQETQQMLHETVRAIKWWKYRTHHERPDVMPKYPKGYPLERMVDHYYHDNSFASVEDAVAFILTKLGTTFKDEVDAGSKPDIRDAGLPARKVLAKIDIDDLRDFAQQAAEAAAVSRSAIAARDAGDKYEAARQWRSLFGDAYPLPAGQPNNDRKYDERPGGQRRAVASASTPGFA
jgi:hypothetical protein